MQSKAVIEAIHTAVENALSL